MRTPLRRLRRRALLTAFCLAVPVLGQATASAAPPPDPVTAAASWLTTQFVGESHLPSPSGDHFDSKFGSTYFPNYGENADVLFALAAAKVGGQQAQVALDYLDAHLDDYADPSGSFGGPFDGSLAKAALARIVVGTSANDLLTMLKADECAAGSATCTPGAPAGIFASASDSFVILAEARAGGTFAPSPDAVDYFLSLQCANGGFTTGTDPCGSGDADLDATSYALMALQALGGHNAEADAAANWLVAQREPAGYWISQGVPNTNSTGLAAAALAGLGRDVSSSRSWLLDQQRPAGEPGAGALKYDDTFTPTTLSATSPSVLATAQGVLGLVDDGSLATVNAVGSSQSVHLFPARAEVSAHTVRVGDRITATGVGFAAGERVEATVNDTHSYSASTDPSGVVEIEIPIAADNPVGVLPVELAGAASGLHASASLTLVAAGGSSGGGGGTGSPPPGEPPLADTGAHTSGLMTVGFASLLAGAGLVALARQRRRGRHAA